MGWCYGFNIRAAMKGGERKIKFTGNFSAKTLCFSFYCFIKVIIGYNRFMIPQRKIYDVPVNFLTFLYFFFLFVARHTFNSRKSTRLNMVNDTFPTD